MRKYILGGAAAAVAAAALVPSTAAADEPLECKIPLNDVSDSTVLCKVGKRYCRDGMWTGCLGVAGYTK